jgi:hypothetical protein
LIVVDGGIVAARQRACQERGVKRERLDVSGIK